MPYIKQEDRDVIIEKIETSFKVLPWRIDTPGEMNYAITEMMVDYLERKGISYTNMNELIGVLECAKLELYRRMAVPYEDHKIRENGDVKGYEGNSNAR